MTTTTLPLGAARVGDAAGTRTRTRTGRAWPLSLAGLLVVTAALYIWGLSASGWSNSFYAAAVQAGTKNWEAFFFGSSDAGNSITVDKPPAALWVMGLSARIFGLSSWSMLVPEALMGVATVAIVAVTVRKRFGGVAGILSGLTLALTPVAALMFRFNNPDALLLLLLTASVALTLRAIEREQMRWLVLAGVAVGFGFLTKQLQAFLVLPVLAGAYLAFARTGWVKRVLHLLAAGAAVVVSAGWWVAIVELTPASMRPYVGGSQTNSFLQLTFGYNGLGRITGAETGSVTGGGTPAGTTAGTTGTTHAATTSMWGQTGLFRLFTSEFGGQISWLIPAALVLFVAALMVIGRAPRTDMRRALIVTAAGWLLVTQLVFSFMSGIFHPYYTVALSAPIAMLIGAAGWTVFGARDRLWVRVVLAVTVLGTAVWAWALLERSSTWLPWLKFAVMALAVASALLVLFGGRGVAMSRVAGLVTAATLLLAPLASSLETVATPHTGSIPSAGPQTSGGFGGGPGGGMPGGGNGGLPGGAGGFPGGTQAGGSMSNGQSNGQSNSPGGAGQNGTGSTGTGTGAANGFPQGGPGGQNGTSQTGTGQNSAGQNSAGSAGAMPGGAGDGGFGGGMGGGILGGSTSVPSAVKKALEKDASQYTWVAAAVGSNEAAGYQLATGDAVMPLGGFNGSDPSPTLKQFEKYVAEGKIHYFIAGGGSGGMQQNGGSNAAAEITSWVEAHYTAKTVGGLTMYDLTAAAK
ncbi:MAG: glycosyltransferase family 39 protein [Microbacteriaceae bacterium]|nr:glycosyltransferase family 39 protein [Microbacteriaceae bacterium]